MQSDVTRFVADRAPFLEYLKEWEGTLPTVEVEDVVVGAGGPDQVAVIGTDLLKGFCHEGALSSPRVAALIGPWVRILTRAHEAGVHRFLFPSDAHPPDSPEFGAFPPHCVEGTPEAELVDEIRALPFAARFHVMPKRSVNSFVETDLDQRLQAASGLRALVVMGDVTDLCVYQLALHAKHLADARHLPRRVIVPASAVATYDLPVDTARRLGVMPHDGDLLHLVFLYHLQLNGVQVVKDLV